MIKRTILYSALFIFCCSLKADLLSSLKDRGWTSYHAGFKGAGFDIGVDTKGHIKLFISPRKNQRINPSWPIETEIHIERREKDSNKWVQKKTSLTGFTVKNEDKVELGQKEIEFTATVTGGAQFAVKMAFDRDGVNIESEMANTPEDSETADYRLVLEGSMPTLLTTSAKYEDKELKSKTSGDYIRITFKKEREQKIRLSDTKNISEINQIHPTSISLRADKIGRKKLTWKILNYKDKGALELDFKSKQNRFIGGYNIRAILINEKGERMINGIRLEYK